MPCRASNCAVESAARPFQPSATLSRKLLTRSYAMSDSAPSYASPDRAKQRANAIAHARVAPIQFLIAWKRAVAMAGPEFFTAGRGHDAPPSMVDATDKGQLIPHWDVVENGIGPLSTSQRVFLAAICSFYNGEWGKNLPDTHGDGCDSIGDVANRLDRDQVDILTALMNYHTGW